MSTVKQLHNIHGMWYIQGRSDRPGLTASMPPLNVKSVVE